MYQRVFVAGTFDHLHKGHEALLSAAFTQGNEVVVGITPDAFVRKIKSHPPAGGSNVKSFDERRRTIETWLHEKGLSARATIIPIIDQYEPAASDSSLDGLIVTAHNKATGEEINERRKKAGFKELALIEVPIVPAEDGKPISATRVRNGEITGEGKLIMPEALRVELGKPLGRVLPSSEVTADALNKKQGRTIVTVGDVVTKTFLDSGITPTLAIIDLQVGRKPDMTLAFLAEKGQHIPSGPGFISRAAIEAIGQWAETLQLNSKLSFEDKAKLYTASENKKEVIVIDGEEDLLVLPVLLAAPLESLVYYGQPGAGVVEVEVTIEEKKEMADVLRKFQESEQ